MVSGCKKFHLYLLIIRRACSGKLFSCVLGAFGLLFLAIKQYMFLDKFRSAQFLQVMSDTQTIHEMQNLSMFLATQNKIKDTLKSELQAVCIQRFFLLFILYL